MPYALAVILRHPIFFRLKSWTISGLLAIIFKPELEYGST